MVEWKVSLCSVNFLCIARIASNFTSARFAAQNSSLLGCDAVSLGEWFTIFQRFMVPGSAVSSWTALP
jgi:hypothetical protein